MQASRVIGQHGVNCEDDAPDRTKRKPINTPRGRFSDPTPLRVHHFGGSAGSAITTKVTHGTSVNHRTEICTSPSGMSFGK